MMTLKRATWGAVLAGLVLGLGCSGSDGANGAAGPAGSNGTDGKAGVDGKDGKAGTNGKDGAGVVAANDIKGTVTDGNAPLAGVAVTVTPGNATATTAADGTFTLAAMPLGGYEVTFHLDGYFDQTIGVGVAASGPTTMTVAMGVDITKGTAPSITFADQLNAGYATAVAVQSTVVTSPAGLAVTYKWTQTGGPALAPADITGATTDKIGFTTEKFTDAVAPILLENARFGVMGINPDQAANYSFELAATDANGRVTKSTVTVNATRPTTGLNNVPIGAPVHLEGDAKYYGANWPTGALPATCLNNVKDAAETDVDCGGPACAPCGSGKVCAAATDCSSSVCTTLKCAAAALQTTWDWKLASKPAGSTATLTGATTQFPTFTPDSRQVQGDGAGQEHGHISRQCVGR